MRPSSPPPSDRKREFDLNGETVRLLRQELRDWSASVVDGEPLVIDAEALADAPYWRRLGEALIVTGSVNGCLHLRKSSSAAGARCIW